jgi:hypothetical protein
VKQKNTVCNFARLAFTNMRTQYSVSKLRSRYRKAAVGLTSSHTAITALLFPKYYTSTAQTVLAAGKDASDALQVGYSVFKQFKV